MDVNLKIFFLFSFPFVSRQTNHAKITHRKRKKSETDEYRKQKSKLKGQRKRQGTMQEKKRTSGSLRPKAMGRLKKDLEGRLLQQARFLYDHLRARPRIQIPILLWLSRNYWPFVLRHVFVGGWGNLHVFFSDLTRLGMLTSMVIVEKAYSKEN